ncbi:arylsulfatase [Pyruvatibacter sp.]
MHVRSTRKTLVSLAALTLAAGLSLTSARAQPVESPEAVEAAQPAQTSQPPQTPQPIEKPNFLIVMVDDMGWSDPGFLGSKIRTPHIDALAERGTFMSNFYVAPTCSPTRSMLMTGVSNHAAGVGTMHTLQAPNQLGRIEYGAQLHDGVVTVAEMLKANGYATMMSGKWHLAIDEDQRPHNRGFDRAFGLLEGASSHFADQRQIGVLESVTYLEDGKPTELPDDFYSSIGYTDKIIEYMDGASDTPFFAYLAYTAPHDPLQVPDDWLDRYKGVFDDGPAAEKEQRRQRLVELGLISPDSQLDAPLNFPSWLPSYKAPWAERSPEERATDIRRMEIYAAMVELLDQQLGRVVARLEETGRLDNTYIVFLSDNGASVTTPIVYRGNTREWLHDNYDQSPERMGQAGSFTTMGRDWANSSNTPFRMFKATVAEGGVRSPMIISGPGLERGVIRNSTGHVTDLAPTLYELAGITSQNHPVYEGKLQPRGRSILPILASDEGDDTRPIVTELFGNRMVRKGNMKAVFLGPPVGNSEWELFDIAADPSATANLADQFPEKLAEMVQAYEDFAATNNVVTPEPPLALRPEVFFEGECNWWCEARFSAAETLVNPSSRNTLFAVIGAALLLGGFMLVRSRRRKRAA